MPKKEKRANPFVTCSELEGINKHLQACNEALSNSSVHQINFSGVVVGEAWPSPDVLQPPNETFLASLRNHVNVYAIFLRRQNQSWEMVYVGQTKKDLARTRIINHLFTKDDGTGAKLAFVQQAVRDGFEVGMKCILVRPEPMRKAVEEYIIQAMKDQLPWNTHRYSRS